MSTDYISELVECLTLKDGVSRDVREWQQGNGNSMRSAAEGGVGEGQGSGRRHLW